MSPQTNFEFLDFVPPGLIRAYYEEIVAKNGKVYVAVVQNEAQIGTVYLERPREKDGNLIDGFIRVFFDVNQLKHYGSQIAMKEGLHPDLVRRWELPFQELIEHVKTLDERRRAMNKPGVMAVMYTILDNKFVEIDTVWTSRQDIMV